MDRATETDPQDVFTTETARLPEWKDTVLLRSGETVDILLNVSNPGLWMAHCHIAEHNQSGMMFRFTVARPPEPAR